ncbi:MAG: DMT family transporter [Spirochaetales bacterium]|nr:DMT family transporter [Spirochaetales bacterium]
MKKTDTPFFLLLVVAMAFWSGSWVSAKLVSAVVNPYIVIFWRFVFTALSFLVIGIIKRKTLILPDLRGLFFILCGALSISVYNYCFIMGVHGSLAGKGGVLVTTINPLFTFMITTALFRQKSDRTQKTGLLIGLAGGVILLEPWMWNSGSLEDRSNLLFLAGALSWSLLTIFSQHAQKKSDPITFNFLLYLAATLIILPLLPNDWLVMTKEMPLDGWINILYLAVFASAVGAGLYFLAAHRLGASRASTFIFLVPVMALVFSRILLGEIAGWTTLAGGFLSIMAVLIINGKIRIKRLLTS